MIWGNQHCLTRWSICSTTCKLPVPNFYNFTKMLSRTLTNDPSKNLQRMLYCGQWNWHARLTISRDVLNVCTSSCQSLTLELWRNVMWQSPSFSHWFRRVLTLHCVVIWFSAWSLSLKETLELWANTMLKITDHKLNLSCRICWKKLKFPFVIWHIKNRWFLKFRKVS